MLKTRHTRLRPSAAAAQAANDRAERARLELAVEQTREAYDAGTGPAAAWSDALLALTLHNARDEALR